MVIGWIAGVDHRADVARIEIADALRRLVTTHENVRIECIGGDLGLPERYRHDGFVPFPELPRRIGGFDVGIAPLADLPGNRVRSDIKLKEYAASGVPWLASAVGPYLGLGEAEGAGSSTTTAGSSSSPRRPSDRSPTLTVTLRAPPDFFS
jgi:hypothetical protein